MDSGILGPVGFKYPVHLVYREGLRHSEVGADGEFLVEHILNEHIQRARHGPGHLQIAPELLGLPALKSFIQISGLKQKGRNKHGENETVQPAPNSWEPSLKNHNQSCIAVKC